MYPLSTFCFVCLNKKRNLQAITKTNPNDVILLHKLSSCAFEMVSYLHRKVFNYIIGAALFQEWITSDIDIHICNACYENVQLTFDFLKMCRQNSIILKDYIAQLKFVSDSVKYGKFELAAGAKSKFDGNMVQDLTPIQNNPALQVICTPDILNPAEGSSAISVQSADESSMDTDCAETGDLNTNQDTLHKDNKLNDIKEEIDEDADPSEDDYAEDDSKLDAYANTGSSEDDEPSASQDNITGDDDKKDGESAREFRHVCSLCQKSFKFQSFLNRHMTLHTGERQHKCTMCDKSFTRKSNLDTHMITHTSLKPHKCSECAKCFVKKSHLKRHMLIHTGEKPYECTVCPKTFSLKAHLKIHLLTHTGERPHKCTECNKTFTRITRLNSHMLTHTGADKKTSDE